MKLTDTFIRHVTANGKIQKHSDGGACSSTSRLRAKNRGGWRTASRASKSFFPLGRIRP